MLIPSARLVNSNRATTVRFGLTAATSRLRFPRKGFFCAVGGVMSLLTQLCVNDEAQDIAEYAVMLAVILVLVVGTIRLVGSNANNVFSEVASSVH
jgi:Flp pilus assembly pilin Flp